MKTCPVCKSNCFDDMDVCFGCLHDFRRDADSGTEVRQPLHEACRERKAPEQRKPPVEGPSRSAVRPAMPVRTYNASSAIARSLASEGSDGSASLTITIDVGRLLRDYISVCG